MSHGPTQVQRLGIVWLILLIAGLIGAIGVESRAQAPTETQVASWFAKEWEGAQRMPDLGDASICWRLEFWDLPTDPQAELKRLREEIQGRPDHPGRRKIEHIERALRGDPYSNICCLWARDDGRWRLNTTFAPGVYVDNTIVGKTLWQLSHYQLSIGSADTKPLMEESLAQLHTFWPQVGHMLHGGLSDGVISRLRPGKLVWDGREWKVELTFGPESDPGYRAVVSGGWDEKLGRGFVERRVLTRSEVKPDSVGSIIRYLDWRFIEPLNLWVAHRVEDCAPDGRVLRAYAFLAWHEGKEGDFEKVTAVPSAYEDDPVRGQLTFKKLADHRRGISTKRESVEDELANPAAINYPNARGIWRRWLGWICAAALTVGLILMYLKRR